MAGLAGPASPDDGLGQRGFRAAAPRKDPGAGAGALGQFLLGGPGMRQDGRSSPGGMGIQRRFGLRLVAAPDPCRGVAMVDKALDFDPSMRGFESFLPCQTSRLTL